MKAARGRAGIQVSVQIPAARAADVTENRRTASYGILTGQERRCAGKRTPAFQKFGARSFRLAPFAKTRQSLDSGSPRALAGKKRRTSKRPQVKSKIRSSDNRARSGRNDGPLENPRSAANPANRKPALLKGTKPGRKIIRHSGEFSSPQAGPAGRASRFFFADDVLGRFPGQKKGRGVPGRDSSRSKTFSAFMRLWQAEAARLQTFRWLIELVTDGVRSHAVTRSPFVGVSIVCSSSAKESR